MYLKFFKLYKTNIHIFLNFLLIFVSNHIKSFSQSNLNIS